jgi:hypothetical protein
VTPCSLEEVYECFEGTWLLHLLARRISQSAIKVTVHFSTTKMEATCSSETLVKSYQTKRRHIQRREVSTLHPHITVYVRPNNETLNSMYTQERSSVVVSPVAIDSLSGLQGHDVRS